MSSAASSSSAAAAAPDARGKNHLALYCCCVAFFLVLAVLAIVLPMAAFGAAVYVTNRMSNESEMTVLKATGLSPWRLARPVLVFGVIIGVIMAALSSLIFAIGRGWFRSFSIPITLKLFKLPSRSETSTCYRSGGKSGDGRKVRKTRT